ncbi:MULTISPECIES: hypothetical protein [unclassified Sphingomonas]|jgi:hypothetical protein|uniref:hypothetical protein n=1 Tax=unclassified Sphingomonas TaxID=196159 RepID=UPI0025CEAC56|nr:MULTISPECIES: hypothetical protein [unclassified Sphingomonas]
MVAGPDRPAHAAEARVTIPAAVIARAARCWRTARDRHEPAQQRLHRLLAPLGYDMLAPVLDSVMTLGECCLGRPLCRGCPFGPDGDEALLCRLLADPATLGQLPPCLAAPRDPAAHAMFAHALAAAVVMMDMAQDRP